MFKYATILVTAASSLVFAPYKSTQERATRVRACNYVKFENGRSFPTSTKNSNTHFPHYVE